MADQRGHNSNRKNIETIRGVLTRLEEMAAVNLEVSEGSGSNTQPAATAALTDQPALPEAGDNKRTALARLSLGQRISNAAISRPPGLSLPDPPPVVDTAPSDSRTSIGGSRPSGSSAASVEPMPPARTSRNTDRGIGRGLNRTEIVRPAGSRLAPTVSVSAAPGAPPPSDLFQPHVSSRTALAAGGTSQMTTDAQSSRAPGTPDVLARELAKLPLAAQPHSGVAGELKENSYVNSLAQQTARQEAEAAAARRRMEWERPTVGTDYPKHADRATNVLWPAAAIGLSLALPVLGWLGFSMYDRFTGIDSPSRPTVTASKALAAPSASPVDVLAPRPATTKVAPAPANAPSVPRERRLSVGNVLVERGQVAALPIAIEPTTGLSVQDTRIVIRGLPAGAKINKGQLQSPGTWMLGIDELDNVSLSVPEDASSPFQLMIALTMRQGDVIASSTSRVDIRPGGEPQVREERRQTQIDKAADPLELEARASIYMQRGQDLLASGNVASARAFFRRAADAGDAQGAIAMGATYDPNYFQQLGIQGMLADSATAQQWYEKAAELGSKDALDRIKALEK